MNLCVRMFFQKDFFSNLCTIIAARQSSSDSHHKDLVGSLKTFEIVIWTRACRLRSSRRSIHLLHHQVNIKFLIIYKDFIFHLNGQGNTFKLGVFGQVCHFTKVTARVSYNFPSHIFLLFCQVCTIKKLTKNLSFFKIIT